MIPCMDFSEELSPTERAGLVAMWLAQGETLTVNQVAAKLAISATAAAGILAKLQNVLPVTRHWRGHHYVWRLDTSAQERALHSAPANTRTQ